MRPLLLAALVVAALVSTGCIGDLAKTCARADDCGARFRCVGGQCVDGALQGEGEGEAGEGEGEGDEGEGEGEGDEGEGEGEGDGGCGGPGAVATSFTTPYDTRWVTTGVAPTFSLSGASVAAGADGELGARYPIRFDDGDSITLELDDLAIAALGKVALSLRRDGPAAETPSVEIAVYNGVAIGRVRENIAFSTDDPGVPYTQDLRFWRITRAGPNVELAMSADGVTFVQLGDLPAPAYIDAPFVAIDYEGLTTTTTFTLVGLARDAPPEGFCPLSILHDDFTLGDAPEPLFTAFATANCANQEGAVGLVLSLAGPAGGQCFYASRLAYDVGDQGLTVDVDLAGLIAGDGAPIPGVSFTLGLVQPERSSLALRSAAAFLTGDALGCRVDAPGTEVPVDVTDVAFLTVRTAGNIVTCEAVDSGGAVIEAIQVPSAFEGPRFAIVGLATTNDLSETASVNVRGL